MITDYNILTSQGYFSRHLQLCATCSQLEAYEQLEDEYYKLTGKNKHQTYEAFRTAKSRYFALNR
jgi:hypothetical protein